MWIRYLLPGIIGLAGGLIVAASVAAFIVKLGIVTRLAKRTSTDGKIRLYEDFVMAGIIIGNLCTVFDIPMKLGIAGLIVFGAFTGIFVGCFVVALAEVLDSMPVISKRLKLYHGIRWIVVSLALGKSIGSLLSFYIMSLKI